VNRSSQTKQMMKCGGKAKKMKKGGQAKGMCCRGMGAARRGGKFTRSA